MSNTATSKLHSITARTDGPDLDDLVRLIRYCREHDIVLTPGATATCNGPFRLRLYANPAKPIVTLAVTEGVPLDRAYFVGPDGTVYDSNREAI